MTVLGRESTLAAQASECAAEQGQFWAYRDRLFAEQRGRDRGAFSTPNLKRFGADLGLDQGAFSACVENDLAAARVRAEVEEGRRKGVVGTPTLFVNGRKIEGVPRFEDLLHAIQTALVPPPSVLGDERATPT